MSDGNALEKEKGSSRLRTTSFNDKDTDTPPVEDVDSNTAGVTVTVNADGRKITSVLASSSREAGVIEISYTDNRNWEWVFRCRVSNSNGKWRTCSH